MSINKKTVILAIICCVTFATISFVILSQPLKPEYPTWTQTLTAKLTEISKTNATFSDNNSGTAITIQGNNLSEKYNLQIGKNYIIAIIQQNTPLSPSQNILISYDIKEAP